MTRNAALQKGQHVQKISITEMQMLLWICDHTMGDKIINDDIQDKFKIESIQEKLVQHHLRWFGHM
jgi:hypothetical protein